MTRSWSTEAERYGLPALLALTVVFFTVYGKTADTFPTAANFDNVVGNQSVLALAAIAAIVPLVAGEFDLSVGAVLGFSAVVTAQAADAWGLPLAAAALVGVATGASVGLVNGVMVTRLGLNSLIATLATATVLGGAASAVSATPIVSGIPASLTDFGSGDWLGVPRTAYLLLAVALLVWYGLDHTPVGRELRAIGTNATAARLVGIGVDRLRLSTFVAAGTIAGAAGVLQLARSGSGDPAVGPAFTLPAIAAAFLGATAIRPGRFNVAGTIIAIFFLAALVSGLTISGSQAWLQDIVNGGALAVGIAISTLAARRRVA